MAGRSVAGILISSVSACLVAVSCSEPSVRDYFIEAQDAPYEFCLDMSDSLSMYDLVFFARGRAAVPELRLEVTWVSPERDSVRETVFLPQFDAKGIVAPYRSGVVPPLKGEWILSVDMPDAPAGFCGLGLTLTKKKKWVMGN